MNDQCRQRIPNYVFAALTLCLLLISTTACNQTTAATSSITAPADSQAATQHAFQYASPSLSAFLGRPITFEAIVVEPARRTPDERFPVAFYVHGFERWPSEAQWLASETLAKLSAVGSDYPRMVYVFPRAQFEYGHHEFADSENNGPWGNAFVNEFLPEIERQYRTVGTPESRFVSGHSSGGWSALWLQVAYPDTFGGAWGLSPDPVDFHDFCGIDLYNEENMYVDKSGKERPLSRKGLLSETFRAFVERELASQPIGGQFYSFDAVFSPRDSDGTPTFIFDRTSGKIDPSIAKTWKRYDIANILESRWQELEPKLAGKLHVFCGDKDTYRLEGAVRRLKVLLKKLNSDAEVVLVPGMNHNSLGPSSQWPDGWLEFAHRAMWARYESLHPGIVK